VSYSADYLDAVLRKTVEQLRADLSAEGFAMPEIDASVEGSAFLFDMVKDGQRRWWRYVIDEPVYSYAPDGTDSDAHGLWLATLLAEENTTMLHRE
jgi:hypothetical protein